MEKKKKNTFNLGLIIGIAGTLAGIYLIIAGDTFFGICGSIASAGLAYQSYVATKKAQSNKES